MISTPERTPDTMQPPTRTAEAIPTAAETGIHPCLHAALVTLRRRLDRHAPHAAEHTWAVGRTLGVQRYDLSTIVDAAAMLHTFAAAPELEPWLKAGYLTKHGPRYGKPLGADGPDLLALFEPHDLLRLAAVPHVPTEWAAVLRLPTGAAILCAFEHPAAPATLLRTYDDTRAALDCWRTDLAALRGPYVIEIFLPDPRA